MKTSIIGTILAITMIGQLKAGIPFLSDVTVPLYFIAGQDGERLQYASMPVIVGHWEPSAKVACLSKPAKALGDDQDLNLVSIYGLKVTVISPKDDSGIQLDDKLIIAIDASKAIRPKQYPLSIDEVVAIAAKAIRIEFKNYKRLQVVISDGQNAITPF